MKLTLFDLDNTLLNGDSDFEWSQFLIRIGVIDRELFEVKNLEFYEQYKAGTLDIAEFLDFQLKPLSRHSRKTLEVWHAQFMQESVLPMITPKSREVVNEHLAAGDVCVIITATNRFVTGPIAGLLGVPALIATEPERDAGGFTGRALDPPCFRAGKVACLARWQTRYGYEGAYRYFYSDSHNDLPLLEQVDVPVAVDADPELAAIAATRGWTRISLRSARDCARAEDG